MNQPEPMAAQWAQIDDMVEHITKNIKRNPVTTADIALDLLTLEMNNPTRVLAMIAATALQQLASKD